jgi:hypothetical protein
MTKQRLRSLLTVLTFTCWLTLAVLVATGRAAPQPQPQLKLAAHGQRVADLQWLLSGHKPSVYHRSIRTYSGPIDGEFGPLTAEAVRGMKWRLGYPVANVDARAGRQLFDFLLGRKARPRDWVGVASARAGRPGGFNATVPQTSQCGARMVRIARAELGVHEIPDGSNDGPRIRVYQRVTGAFGCPGAHDCPYGQWCASFAQWDRVQAGAGKIPARLPALVFSIVDYGHDHAMLHAQAKPGALVAYLRNLGHIGVVESVTRDGFWAIEGNYSNRVARVFHRVGEQRTVFIWPPATCN